MKKKKRKKKIQNVDSNNEIKCFLKSIFFLKNISHILKIFKNSSVKYHEKQKGLKKSL